MTQLRYGIEGEEVKHLAYLGDCHSLAVLRLLAIDVDPDARKELRSLIDSSFGKKYVRVEFIPVRTTSAPYMIGPDMKRRHWNWYGGIYTCVHAGTMKDGRLEMVPTGQEDAVMIWLCLRGN